MLSAAIPRISSLKTEGMDSGFLIRPDRSRVRPETVPIHRESVESVSKQVMLSLGYPSRDVKTLHLFLENMARPLGVPNHIVPSGPSAIEETVFDGKPFAMEKVLK